MKYLLPKIVRYCQNETYLRGIQDVIPMMAIVAYTVVIINMMLECSTLTDMSGGIIFYLPYFIGLGLVCMHWSGKWYTTYEYDPVDSLFSAIYLYLFSIVSWIGVLSIVVFLLITAGVVKVHNWWKKVSEEYDKKVDESLDSYIEEIDNDYN